MLGGNKRAGTGDGGGSRVAEVAGGVLGVVGVLGCGYGSASGSGSSFFLRKMVPTVARRLRGGDERGGDASDPRLLLVSRLAGDDTRRSGGRVRRFDHAPDEDETLSGDGVADEDGGVEGGVRGGVRLPGGVRFPLSLGVEGGVRLLRIPGGVRLLSLLVGMGGVVERGLTLHTPSEDMLRKSRSGRHPSGARSSAAQQLVVPAVPKRRKASIQPVQHTLMNEL
mmetsp:Transcript_9996/g.25814  ORF Transcript_9996/g.25814 Transcript_9996/m.25814 type:complete len:224 (-) Transcript_9996:1006-1677(-)